MGRKPKVREEKKEGPTSLFILTESNPIRRLTVFLIEWPPFEYTVLLTIIANCVVLAIEEPQPNKDKTELAKQLVSTLDLKKRYIVTVAHIQRLLFMWPNSQNSATYFSPTRRDLK